jgi:hypothetical protein
MTTEEALALIAETNEPLAVVLRDLMAKIDRIDHSPETLLEPLLTHLMTQGKASTFDLSVLIDLLNTKRKN